MNNNKPRILFIPSLTATNDLGGSTHQVELLKNLIEYFQIIMINKEWKTFGIDSNITANDLPKLRKSQFRGPISILYILKAIVSSLRLKKDFDIIYSRHGVATFPSIFISHLLNKPLIIEFNGIISKEMQLTNFKYENRIFNYLDRIGCHHSTKIIAITPGLKDYLINHFKILETKIDVIPNGVNTSLFIPMEREKSREILKYDKKLKIVTFIGTIAYWQGLNFLIEAIAILVQKEKNIKALIIGDGPMKDKLMMLTKHRGLDNNIIFTGKIPYTDVPLYINISDICVSPFIKERNELIGLSPLKIFEYMACGKPIISSRIKGLDFIEKENVGVLVEPENSKDLARSILDLIHNEKHRIQLGENARKLATQQFSWQEVSKKVSGVCYSIIT